jgi:hypothetical protein
MGIRVALISSIEIKLWAGRAFRGFALNKIPRCEG